VIRLGNASSCRLCSSDLVSAGGDYANCATGQWNGTDYECTEYNSAGWHQGATWCKRMSGISGCYGSNIDDGSNYVTLDDLAVTGGTPDISVGACCKPDTSCVIASNADCDLLGGHWAGGGTTCQFTECLCPIPFADADHDGDVDQADFGAWQICYSGSAGGGVPSGCACFNRDGDSDVDSADFTAFDHCWTGPNVKYRDLNPPPLNCVP